MSSTESDPSRTESSSAVSAPSSGTLDSQGDDLRELDRHSRRDRWDLWNQGRSRRALSSTFEVKRDGHGDTGRRGEGVAEPEQQQQQYRYHRSDSIGGGGGDPMSHQPRPSRIGSVDSGFGQRSKQAKEGAGYDMLEVGGRCVGGVQQAVGVPREGGGGGAENRGIWERKEPSRKTKSTEDPLSRFISSVSAGSNMSDWSNSSSGISGGSKATATGSGVARGPAPVFAVPARKKKTFMEKVGDMLEAAAETAIPAAPVNGGVKRPRRTPAWEHWDAVALGEFMVEETRAMADSKRLEDVKRAGADKGELIGLAKTWRVPFLSQVDFNRQKAALRNPGVGTVGHDGRCIPAAPSRARKSQVVPPPPPPPSASSSSLILSRSSHRQDSPGGEVLLSVNDDVYVNARASGGEGGGDGHEAGDDQNSKEDEGEDELTGITAGGGWICGAAVLGGVGEMDDEEWDRGSVHGAGEEGLLCPPTHIADTRFYLVEVEKLVGGDGSGGKWGCYKRYSDFSTLWWGLSRLYPVLREQREEEELAFLPRVASALLSLSGVMFPAARLAMERRRVLRLNGMLRVMLQLNPRPQELVRFLEPHAAAGDPPIASAVVEAYKTRRSLDFLKSERKATSIQRRGRGRGGRRSCLLEDAIPATPLPTTPALRLFLVTVAALEALAAMFAAGIVRSVEVWVIIAWMGVAACAACVVTARWASNFRQRWRQRSPVGSIDVSGLRGSRAVKATEVAVVVVEDASVRVGQKTDLEKERKEEEVVGPSAMDGSVVDPATAAGQWIRVIIGGEILATGIVVMLYVTNATPWGLETYGNDDGVCGSGSYIGGGGGGETAEVDVDAPARDAVWLIAVAGIAVGAAAKDAVFAVVFAAVLPPVVAAIITRNVVGTTDDGGDRLVPSTAILEETMLRLAAIGGGVMSLLCGVSAASLPLFTYFLTRLRSFLLSLLLLLFSFRRPLYAAPRPKESSPYPTMTHRRDDATNHAVGSSREDASGKRIQASAPASSAGNTRATTPVQAHQSNSGSLRSEHSQLGVGDDSGSISSGGSERERQKDDPADSRGAVPHISLWRRVKARINRVRVSAARAVMPKSEGVDHRHREDYDNDHSHDELDKFGLPAIHEPAPQLPSSVLDETPSSSAASQKPLPPSASGRRHPPLPIAKPDESAGWDWSKTSGWRFQGALERKCLEWASPALGMADRAAAAVYAPRGHLATGRSGALGTCGNEVARATLIRGESTVGARGRIERSVGPAVVGTRGIFTGPFGSLADVVLVWAVVGLMCLTLGRECRLARRRRWRRLALALAAKLVVGGWLLGGYVLWNTALSPPTSLGGVQALLLCAVEAWRCIAVLALILVAIQAGSGCNSDASENTAVHSKRSTSRSRVDDPTTPRGEHLTEPIVLLAGPSNAHERRSPRGDTILRSTRGSGPTAPLGGGGWFSASLHGTAGSDGGGGSVGGAVGRMLSDLSSSLHDPHGVGGGRDHDLSHDLSDELRAMSRESGAVCGDDDGWVQDGVHDRE